MYRGQQHDVLSPRHDSSTRVEKKESVADRMAALKARVAAAVGPAQATAKGGLNTPIHPILAELNAPLLSSSSRNDDTQRPPRRPYKPSTQRSDAPRANPYLEAAHAPGTGHERQPRQLIFNQKGKYIAQANALRQQAKLEEMKKRIADQARKAGLVDDPASDKAFKLGEPPELEWWDEALIDGEDYSKIPGSLKISTPDSIVTVYIQHPVSIEPPQQKLAPEPKPMHLTKKETRKLRNQRRQLDRKEKQDKIRLGLEPAPPPKLTLANMFRVSGDSAALDPTAQEAMVRAQVADRYNQHMQANEERKLTKEQQHEKLASQQAKDMALGIHTLVFKIGSLANGQHRYKIDMNAKQWNLSGVCIMNPSFNLVIVEGGEHSISNYKKLMLQRINWQEALPSRKKEGATADRELPSWLKAEDENGQLKDLSANKCVLIFEGEVRAAAYKKWWGNQEWETEQEAVKALEKAKMDSFWTLAKSAPL